MPFRWRYCPHAPSARDTPKSSLQIFHCSPLLRWRTIQAAQVLPIKSHPLSLDAAPERLAPVRGTRTIPGFCAPVPLPDLKTILARGPGCRLSHVGALTATFVLCTHRPPGSARCSVFSTAFPAPVRQQWCRHLCQFQELAHYPDGSLEVREISDRHRVDAFSDSAIG